MLDMKMYDDDEGYGVFLYIEFCVWQGRWWGIE